MDELTAGPTVGRKPFYTNEFRDRQGSKEARDKMTTASIRKDLEPRYNLFRRKRTPDLCCAAPEDRPVPGFVEAETWEYAGTMAPDELAAPGFDPAAASLGLQLKGFHLFQVIRPIKARWTRGPY